MYKYTLPELDYDYGALEPYISGKINEIHYSKHHAAYVKGVNEAIEKLEESRSKNNYTGIILNEKNLSFHLGGHLNHSIWWKNLSPHGGGEPTGKLAEAINNDFGSFCKFKSHLAAAANNLQGSGWGVLGYESLSNRLLVFQLYDQQANVPLGITPLLQLDMWEHAFYLQYKNLKANYIESLWNIINWEDVQSRYLIAISKFGS